MPKQQWPSHSPLYSENTTVCQFWRIRRARSATWWLYATLSTACFICRMYYAAGSDCIRRRRCDIIAHVFQNRVTCEYWGHLSHESWHLFGTLCPCQSHVRVHVSCTYFYIRPFSPGMTLPCSSSNSFSADCAIQTLICDWIGFIGMLFYEYVCDVPFRYHFDIAVCDRLGWHCTGRNIFPKHDEQNGAIGSFRWCASFWLLRPPPCPDSEWLEYGKGQYV